jgi:hypothetical protein
MRDWIQAIATSKALDDRRERSGVSAGLARVDEALSDRSAQGWERAPAGLGARVRGAIEEHDGARFVRGVAEPWRPAWPALVLAGGLALAAGVALVMLAPKPAQAPGTEGRGLPFDAGSLTSLSVQAEPLALAADRALLEEARLIGDDTRRAVEAVMARLPTRWGR